MRRFPGLRVSHLVFAQVLEERGDWRGAVRHIRTFLRRPGGNVRGDESAARRKLALAYLAARDHERAFETYRHCLYNIGNAVAYSYRECGFAAVRAGRAADEISDLGAMGASVLSVTAGDIETAVYIGAAEAHYEKGELTDVDAWLRRGAKATPSAPFLPLFRGVVAWRRGDFDEAQEHYDDIRADSGMFRNPHFKHLLGCLLRSQGKFGDVASVGIVPNTPERKALLDECIRWADGKPKDPLEAARYSYYSGDCEAAVRHFQQASPRGEARLLAACAAARSNAFRRCLRVAKGGAR